MTQFEGDQGIFFKPQTDDEGNYSGEKIVGESKKQKKPEEVNEVLTDNERNMLWKKSVRENQTIEDSRSAQDELMG
jgi:hypothetical protein